MSNQQKEKQFQHQVVRLEESKVNMEISPLFNFLLQTNNSIPATFLENPKQGMEEVRQRIDDSIRFFHEHCHVDAVEELLQERQTLTRLLYELKDLFTNLTILK